MRTVTLTLALAVLSTGCVGAKKHKQLEDAYARLTSENAELRADLADTSRTADHLGAKADALEGANANLAADLEEQQRALAELRKRKADAEKRVQDYRDLVQRFASMIDAGTLSVAVVDGRLVVQMPTDILFPSGSDQVSKEGREQLLAVGKVLADIDRDFQIEGHTDSDPIATERFPSNWALSAGRATSVLRIFQEAGVQTETLSIAGFADTHPVGSNQTAEGKKVNRRIEIVLQPDLSLMPGYDELQQVARDGVAATPE